MLSPHTMESPHTMLSPDTMRSPQTMLFAHGQDTPPITVYAPSGCETIAADDSGSAGLTAVASWTAPGRLTLPAPWVNASTFSIGIAVNCSIALMAFGVRGVDGQATSWASIMDATTPLTTPAAMLVPLSLSSASPEYGGSCSSGYAVNSVLPVAPAATSLFPGATTSGFANPSYHDGPREL